MIESIHKMKQEKVREKQLAEQREARRLKNVVRKEKRVAKKLEQLGGGAKKVEDKPAAQAAPKQEAPKKEAPKDDKSKAAPKKTAEKKPE